MYLKRRVRHKDGKDHVYYSLSESVRVSAERVVQRTVLHLGELNTTQWERWQRTVEVLHEDGQKEQLRLFSDREAQAPQAEDAVEVVLSSLAVRAPRRFGDCWVGCLLWQQLDLGRFWQERLGEQSGAVPWSKVVELLAVNRLCAPRSELFVHEKWFPQSAMDFLLDTSGAVAEKDRLYRCLDRILEHKEALEEHLKQRWKDLFHARYDLLLYDLTSTYFEGDVPAVGKAQRGYSRDHRPDCKQLVIALVVTPEGFPLTYEVLAGNRNDATTLEEMIASIEKKYGRAQRLWVFDRGIVSEENLQKLRERSAEYLVGTPKAQLKKYEQQLLEGSWQKISGEVEVKWIPEDRDNYVLCRSAERSKKERAIRWRVIKGLMRGLIKLRRRIRTGGLKDRAKVLMQLGRLQERYGRAWPWVQVRVQELKLQWKWDRQQLRLAEQRDGAYLLRAHGPGNDPAHLWKSYVQLTEVEAAFRTLKSEVRIRPIWHWLEKRVEAHVLVAFLGYCLWVCLKQRLQAVAPGLTPWQLLDQLGRIQLVEVWFDLKDGRKLCLPRITQPEPVQAILLEQLHWKLPEQPPPRIYANQIPAAESNLEVTDSPDVWPT